jgi:hypothetical protein
LNHLLEKTTLFVTAGFCIAIAVLEALGFTSDVPWLSGKIEIITLLLLSGAVLYLITAQTNTAESLRQIKHELSVGTEVRVFDSVDEVIPFISSLFRSSKKTVDQVIATAMTPEMSDDLIKEYDASQKSFLKHAGVKHRLVTDASNHDVNARQLGNFEGLAGKKFLMKVFEKTDSCPPIMNLIIFDNEKMIMRNPYKADEQISYLYICQPEIVQQFATYYSRIWESALEFEKIDWDSSANVTKLRSKDSDS